MWWWRSEIDPRSRRQFISNRGFDLDRTSYRGAGHHARVMRGEIGKGFGRGLQRIGEPPIESEKMDVGDRIAVQRPAASQTPVGNSPDLHGMIQSVPARGMQRGSGKGHPRQRLRVGLD